MPFREEQPGCRAAGRPGIAGRGFTLPELLVGVAVLCLFAALAFHGVRHVRQAVRVTVAKTRVTQLAVMIQGSREDMGYYPPDSVPGRPAGEEGTVAVLALGPGELPSPYRERWRGPYLDPAEGVSDPWGNPYFYRLLVPPPTEVTLAGPAWFSRARNGQPYRSGLIYFDPVPGGKATLEIDNSQSPVVSGRVYINGQEVLSPDDFRVTRPWIEVELDLHEDRPNHFEIWIASWRGQHNEFELVIKAHLSEGPLGSGVNYMVGSLGADGRPGGRGAAADLVWSGGREWIDFDYEETLPGL